MGPDLHAFPVREAIEVGDGKPDLTVTADYNPGLGVVSSIDFNGHVTRSATTPSGG